MDEAIHTPNCPIWDVNFRPILPPHAQPRAQQQQQANQSVAQQAPNLAAVVASTVAGKAATPTSTISALKQEPCEIAVAEEMEVDQPQEHPSAASARQIKEDPPMILDTNIMEVLNGDISEVITGSDDKDLILKICRDLDDSEVGGEKNVYKVFYWYLPELVQVMLVHATINSYTFVTVPI